MKQVNEVNDAAADIYQQYTVIEIYSNSTGDSPCVVPCPTVIYSAEEWDMLQSVLFLGSLAALIASLVSLVSHLQVSHFQLSIFTDMAISQYCILVISVSVEWCIGKPLSSSMTSYSSTSIHRT